VVYAEANCADFASRDIMPIFECVNMEGLSAQKYSLCSLTEGDAWWERDSPPLEFSLQNQIKPRLSSLVKDYKSGKLPPNWRLAEAMLPPFGHEKYIFLTTLLRPVGDTYECVYCIPRYG
jgi:hypothetical protein